MDFPFITNKIVNPAGGGPTWAEWLEKNYGKKAETDSEVKTAGEAKPECEDDPRGQCRGQVINNDNEEGAGQSYQDGESVKGKSDQAEGKSEKKDASSEQTTKEATCGKEMGECADAGKVTEEHTDSGPGNDENPDPKININNDPNYQKGESTDGGKVTSKNKKTEAKTVSGFRKIASLDRAEKMKLFAALSSNKTYPIEYVEAVTGLKFANLTDEEKTWFKDFWRTMYPESYVADMVEDR